MPPCHWKVFSRGESACLSAWGPLNRVHYKCVHMAECFPGQGHAVCLSKTIVERRDAEKFQDKNSAANTLEFLYHCSPRLLEVSMVSSEKPKILVSDHLSLLRWAWRVSPHHENILKSKEPESLPKSGTWNISIREGRAPDMWNRCHEEQDRKVAA